MDWTLIITLAIGCYVFRSLGVIAGSDVELPAPVKRVLPWLAPAFIGGVIVVTTVVEDGVLQVEVGVVGVGVALLAAVLRATFVLILVLGLGTTILLRLLVT